MSDVRSAFLVVAVSKALTFCFLDLGLTLLKNFSHLAITWYKKKCPAVSQV